MNKIEFSDPMFNKMILIANLYYKEKMSQQEIAKKLSISRPWVSKLLARAEETGIVKIEVLTPFSANTVLESTLINKYGLKHVSVIKKDNTARDDLALVAANYFVSELCPEDVVGVGWGTSVSRLILATEPLCFSKVKVVPLAGSFGNTLDFFPNLSSIRLAKTLSSVAEVIHAPAICRSQEEFDTLTQNAQTKALLQLGEHADILLLGMGTFEISSRPEFGLFTADDIAELKAKQVMGDIALQYLDINGNPVNTDTTKRLIKANIFKASANARTSIGIAEGVHKKEMMHTVLTLKLINALFTDEDTALALLGL